MNDDVPVGLYTEYRCNRPVYTPAGIYLGLKRPRIDYTRAYYGLGQFIPLGILWDKPIHTPSGQIMPYDVNHDINGFERYTQELFNFSTSYLGFTFVS